MYAGIIHFVLGPDTQWESEHIADILTFELKKQPGFQGISCLNNYDIGEYKWIVYWNSETDGSLAYKSLYPSLIHMVGDKFQWEPCLQGFDVYTPKY